MNTKLIIGVLAVVLLIAGGTILALKLAPKSPPASPAAPITPITPTTPISPTVSENISPQPETTQPASGQTKNFVIEGSNFKFSSAILKVKKDDTVVITFKSTEGFHDLKIDELDVSTNQIGEGDEEEVEFVADKTGTFEYYCSVGNHRKNGMVGKLVVE